MLLCSHRLGRMLYGGARARRASRRLHFWTRRGMMPTPLLLLLLAAGARSAPPQAQTSFGTLTGLSRGAVVEFRGIPYAKAPTGSRRFLPPQPWSTHWGSRDAKRHGRVCPQPFDETTLPASEGPGPFAGAEDCLFLNVFRPEREPPPQGFPVLVFVHGGSFVSGASNAGTNLRPEYDGLQLSQNGGTVVVTLNCERSLLRSIACTDCIEPLPDH
jgi:para-nitrobenzyl esterase